MTQVQTFQDTERFGLQNEVNEWLRKNHVYALTISYSIYVTYNIPMYSCAVLYLVEGSGVR